jgi:ABC-type multidrug transport system fused ATPase/permease subunit
VDNAPSLEAAGPVAAAQAVEVSRPGDAWSLRGRIAVAVFPSGPARSGPRWRSVLFSVLFVAAATAASLLRQTGVSAVNSMWAEDGQVFYQSVFRQSYFGALFTSDNGYLDLVPRLFIGVLGHVPVAYAAETFAVTGAIMSSLVALGVYYGSAGHVSSRAMRLCLAIPTAVIIYGTGEVGNSIVNVQWYLIYGFFWMLLWTPRTVWGRLAAAALLCAAIGSDPITVVFVPLLVLRLWALPWRESRWHVGGVLLGVAYQAVGFLQGDAATRPQVPHYILSLAWGGYRGQVLSTTFTSVHELSFLGLGSEKKAEYAGIAILIVIAALGALLARPQWLMAGISFIFSIGFYFVVAMQGGMNNPRYAVTPVLLLVATAVFLAAAPRRAADAPDSEGAQDTAGTGGAASPPRNPVHATLSTFVGSHRASLLPTAVLCIVVGLNLAASYQGGSPARGTSLPWNGQFHAAREACEQPGVSEARLAVAPGAPRNWSVEIPCSKLLP